MTTAAVAGTLWFEKKNEFALRTAFKTVASLGFLFSAIGSGAFGSAFGCIIFVGLVLSLFGDVLLVWRAKPLFLAGLVSFLLAHVAYLVAFAIRGVALGYCGGALACLIVVAALVLRWMFPKVPSDMRIPVIAYIFVISCMVMLAAGTFGRHGGWPIVVGAIMFYLSDLFVARDRFVSPGFDNSLYGLPLYYGAQLLLAYSCAFVA